ncbi:MAG: pseudouridine synthase [Hyphomicrobiaceae bacterium]
MRLDQVLSRALDGLSRARLQALIRDGRVACGGRTIGEPNRRVKPGETYAVDVPPPSPAAPAAEQIPLSVTYEDDHLIVIDKPAGMVVHPAAGHRGGTLVNALIAHCGDSLSGIGGTRRPGIVHRLDKDTSGLLVVAKTDAAHAGLSEQFAAHGRDGRLMRAYVGVCWRLPTRPADTIDAPLGRSTTNRTKIAVSRAPDAREAVTHYEVLEALGGGPKRPRGGSDVRTRRGRAQGSVEASEPGPVAALLRLVLETGRTHQIRVHLAHIGHPLLGDATYGTGFKSSASLLSEAAAAALASLGRQALHAAELGFVHPITGRCLEFSSPLPDDIAALIEALRQGS